MLHIKRILIIICLLFGSAFTIVKPQAASTCEISTYDIAIQVDKNAVLNVKETIDVSSCETRIINKDIQKEYEYDIDENGKKESVFYEIKDIKAVNAKVYSQDTKTKKILEIVLEKPTQKVELSYRIRLRNYFADDYNLFLYKLLSLQNVSLKKLNVSMMFPNRIDTNFQVYVNEKEQPNLNYNRNDKQVDFQLDHLEGDVSLVSEAKLRSFYFTYSNPFSTYLYVSIFSILLTIVCYFGSSLSSKIRKSHFIMESKPISEVPVGLLAYYVDGQCEKEGIISMILQWANEGYITMGEVDDELLLSTYRPFSDSKKEYEKQLYQIIFHGKEEVSISDLKKRIQKKEIYQIMTSMQKEEEKSHRVYRNYCLKFQVLYAMISALPISFISFACNYERAFAMIPSIGFGCLIFFLTSILIYLWFFLKQKLRYDYENKSVLMKYSLTTITVLFGFSLYIYLLKNHAPMVYVIGNLVFTVISSCIFLLLEQRTIYGRVMKERLAGLYQFLSSCRVEQLKLILQEDPEYFSQMLPYVFGFQMYDMWCKQFAFIPLVEPQWYFHTNQKDLSSYYWMSALKQSLDKLSLALFDDYQLVVTKKVYKKDNMKR